MITGDINLLVIPQYITYNLQNLEFLKQKKMFEMKIKLYILRVLEKKSYIYCLINPPIVILNNTHAMCSELSYAVTHLA